MSVGTAGARLQTRDMESQKRPRATRCGRGNAHLRSHPLGTPHSKEQQRHLQPHQRCGALPKGSHVEAQGERSGNSSVTNINRSPFGSPTKHKSHCRDPLSERAPGDPKDYSAEELEENRRQIQILEGEIKEMERDREQRETDIEVMKNHFLSSLQKMKAKWSQEFAEILAVKKYIDPRPGSRMPPSNELKVPFEGRVPAFAHIAPLAPLPLTKSVETAPPTTTRINTGSTWRRGRLADPPIPASGIRLQASEQQTRRIASTHKKAAKQPATPSEITKVMDQVSAEFKKSDVTPQGPVPPELAVSAAPSPEKRARHCKKRLRIAQPSNALINAVIDKRARDGVPIPISRTEEDKENFHMRPAASYESLSSPGIPEDWWIV